MHEDFDFKELSCLITDQEKNLRSIELKCWFESEDLES